MRYKWSAELTQYGIIETQQPAGKKGRNRHEERTATMTATCAKQSCRASFQPGKRGLTRSHCHPCRRKILRGRNRARQRIRDQHRRDLREVYSRVGIQHLGNDFPPFEDFVRNDWDANRAKYLNADPDYVWWASKDAFDASYLTRAEDGDYAPCVIDRQPAGSFSPQGADEGYSTTDDELAGILKTKAEEATSDEALAAWNAQRVKKGEPPLTWESVFLA